MGDWKGMQNGYAALYKYLSYICRDLMLHLCRKHENIYSMK